MLRWPHQAPRVAVPAHRSTDRDERRAQLLREALLLREKPLHASPAALDRLVQLAQFLQLLGLLVQKLLRPRSRPGEGESGPYQFIDIFEKYTHMPCFSVSMGASLPRTFHLTFGAAILLHGRISKIRARHPVRNYAGYNYESG